MSRVHCEGGAIGRHLLLCESRSQPDDVYYIALHDAYIRKLTASKGIKLLSLTLPLFLLLRQALVTGEKRCISTVLVDCSIQAGGEGIIFMPFQRYCARTRAI